MIAGGSEAPITPSSIGGFNASQALSKRNDDPEGASKPFDKDRDGFVLGEGGAALILEEYEHAIKRNAVLQDIEQPFLRDIGCRTCMRHVGRWRNASSAQYTGNDAHRLAIYKKY